jgi:MtrB/PioB family decaheme-associated outer membrane protein
LQATLAYQVSLFRNGQESLTWTNPFTPVVSGAGTGQLALAPDNQFHQIVGSLGYDISPKIRASGDFAFGRMTQDATYLDPTLNLDPAAGLPDRTGLPAQSLRGRANTFNGSVRITANPTERLRLNASYARDLRDNRTPSESYPAVSTDMFLGLQPRSNQSFSFTQDRFKLNAEYRGPGSLKGSVGADQEYMKRTRQEVGTTRETTLGGRLAAQPRDDLSLAFKLAHAQRGHSTYGVATWIDPAENPLLRKYNQADRTRDTAGLRADLTVRESVTLGFNVDYAKDDYNRSVIGLIEARSVNVGADLSAALNEATQVHLFAQGERIRSKQAGSQLFAQPDWYGRSKDAVDTVGLGVKHGLPNGKYEMGADLVFARSRGDVAVDGVSAAPFPTATTALDSLKLHASYRLTDSVSLMGSYWFEQYTAQDWRLDGVLPSTVPNLLSLGEQTPRYSVSIVRVALRYRF